MSENIKLLSLISGQIFFTNLILVFIWLSNVGIENVSIVNQHINTKPINTYEKPILYCSPDKIWYFKETYTIVFDEKNIPKKCSQPNTIWEYDSRYINNYKLYK